jgi:hypothetical protein
MRIMNVMIPGMGLNKYLFFRVLLTSGLLWMGLRCTGDAAMANDGASNIAAPDATLQQLAPQPPPSTEPEEFNTEGAHYRRQNSPGLRAALPERLVIPSERR